MPVRPTRYREVVLTSWDRGRSDCGRDQSLAQLYQPGFPHRCFDVGAYEHRSKLTDLRRYTTLRQTLQKQPAIAFCSQPWIQHCEYAAVGRATNQPAQPLL